MANLRAGRYRCLHLTQLLKQYLHFPEFHFSAYWIGLPFPWRFSSIIHSFDVGRNWRSQKIVEICRCKSLKSLKTNNATLLLMISSKLFAWMIQLWLVWWKSWYESLLHILKKYELELSATKFHFQAFSCKVVKAASCGHRLQVPQSSETLMMMLMTFSSSSRQKKLSKSRLHYSATLSFLVALHMKPSFGEFRAGPVLQNFGCS